MHKILLSKNASKDLKRVSSEDAKQTLQKLQQLSFPFPPFLHIRKLSAKKAFYRLRIAKIRVIFEVDNKTKIIWIRKIGYRKNVYKFLIS